MWVTVLAIFIGPLARGAELPLESIVAKVNGEPVTVAEMQLVLRREKTAVYAHFQTGDAIDSRSFWTTPQKGTTPLEFVREKALDRLVKLKTQQMLMRSQGLWPDISHAAFLVALDRENTRRRTAVAAGQVVYGPVEYSEENYFAYVLGNLRIKSRAQFAAESHFTDSELREVYAQGRAHEFNRGPWVDVMQIVISVAASASPAQRQAAHARAIEARALLERGAAFEEVAAKYRSNDQPLRRRYTRLDVAVGKMETDRLAEAALKLPAGGTSPIIADWNSWAIFKAVARGEIDPAPYEEVREEIRARLAEAGYAKYLDRLAREAKVELIHPAWDEARPE